MRLLSTLRPTQNQLTVLAKIIASQDVPARAAAEISSNTNFIAARNILMKLGLITYTDAAAALTDKGTQVAQEQNIIDENGQLTDEGNALASAEANGKPSKEQPQPGMDQSMGGTPPDMGLGGDIGAPPPMESFSSLFKHILNS